MVSTMVFAQNHCDNFSGGVSNNRIDVVKTPYRYFLACRLSYSKYASIPEPWLRQCILMTIIKAPLTLAFEMQNKMLFV